MTPEGRVKKMVKKALDTLGPDCWRFMPVQTGYGSPALDYLLAIRGRFVSIETKAPGKKLTPLQEGTKAAIEAAGGIVLVVWDETSLELAMKIILALEFAPRVHHSLDSELAACFDAYRSSTGFEQAILCQHHGSPEAERFDEQHLRKQHPAQAPDAATGRDHGTPGAAPD